MVLNVCIFYISTLNDFLTCLINYQSKFSKNSVNLKYISGRSSMRTSGLKILKCLFTQTDLYENIDVSGIEQL